MAGKPVFRGSIDATRGFSLVKKFVSNCIMRRPLVISFEVTLSCVANCRHCDTGGIKEIEERMEPAAYARYIRDLKPVAVQLSGGEPLLRDDLPDIVRTVAGTGYRPLIILVTNAWLLNEAKYLQLKKAGVDRVSISLDFPDQRHDDFRNLPGLYDHLADLIPRLALHGYGDVAMNCAITRANVGSIADVARRCREWGVDVSYSAYSKMRTGNNEFFISEREDLDLLQQQINELVAMKRETRHIVNPRSVLQGIHRFFSMDGMPGCSAGQRFLVIRPEGTLNPCSMHRERRYTDIRELQRDFSDNNTCEGCYVAIRAYSDKSFMGIVKDMMEYAVQ
jgi:MoaA/NifB/PqqE/SkfB family radical SAM enzyme